MPNTTALALPMLSDEDITKALRAGGAIESAPQSNRMKVDGSMFIAGDQLFPYNPVKKDPAFIGRIVRPLIEMQAFWFDAEHARYANRPDIQDKYCKSHKDIPTQARKIAEDGTVCADCPFMPFVKDPVFGKKCALRGDLEIQIMPASGQFEGNEPIWVLNLPMTSVFEFKGTAKDATAGYGGKGNNFMHKLGTFAVKQAMERGEDPGTGVLKAITAYNAGGVVAEFRLIGAASKDNSQTWRVISLEPIFILDTEEAPAIEAGPSDTTTPDGFALAIEGDVPF